jgi:citrate lyase subunit beta/citryl-CoA lyase
MPGSNARALEKARALPADALILDLEDAVSPDKKAMARQQVLDALVAGGYGAREVLVRVNGLDTPWGRDDLAAVAKSGLDGIVAPKISSASDVHALIEALHTAGARSDLALWIMAETARCILDIDRIAASHAQLRGIVMGTSDLGKETRIPHSPDRIGFVAALSICVLAARANGLEIIDGVHLDIRDEAGLRRSCEQGRDLGFDGKSLIHPDQLAVANEVFSPSPAELERAREMITAWDEAMARGSAVVVVGGRLVENLHVEEARRQLELAGAVAVMGW